MKSGSLILVFAAATLTSGCGSRTGEDELLFYGTGAGGRVDNSGAASGIGGDFGSGGLGNVGGGGVGVGGFGSGGSGGIDVGVGGGPGNGCCDMGSGPGCNDPNVAYCVCDQDDYCCTTLWDEICATYAENVCGALCGEPSVGGSSSGGAINTGGAPNTGGAVNTGGAINTGGAVNTGGTVSTGGTGGLVGGDCCVGHSGRGCEVPVVESCVCEDDPYCCNTQWDEICANSAESCGASCNAGAGGAPTSGGAPGAGGAGVGGGSGGSIGDSSCCEQHNSTGCDQRAVQQCVCDDDPYCCNIRWDGQCVDGAGDCGAMCEAGVGGSPSSGGAPGAGGDSSMGGAPPSGGASGNSGDCCESQQSSTGCEDSSVEACVCDDDPYCCNIEWDEVCAGAAEDCGASCSGNPTEEQCDIAFPGACENCACKECYSDVEACLNDFGCYSIFSCMTSRECWGLDCYQPETCQGTIDSFGGLFGSSVQLLYNVMECADNQGCACQ